MSTPPTALFAGLIDDAAVFPPGNHPLGEALQRRFERTGTADAGYVGSFLIPPADVGPTLEQVHPVSIVVIGRPGSPLADVLSAAEAVAHSPIHALAGIQVGIETDWRQCLEFGVPVAVEVPASDFDEHLDDLVPQRFQTLAKLRTGSTPANPVPCAAQLADFILGCHERDLAFKLTGGMHHALTQDVNLPGGSTERQYGFLNVLTAVDAALHGAEPAAVRARLDLRRRDEVLSDVLSIDQEQAHQVRDLFQSYGCCDVEDPINDLRALNLIQETS